MTIFFIDTDHRLSKTKMGAVLLGCALQVVRRELRIGAITPLGEKDGLKLCIGAGTKIGIVRDNGRSETGEIPAGEKALQSGDRPELKRNA